ncbi:MAG: hypothetical protein DRG20_00075 [Deltaproteobacteria bacterium]|nr:MAG: hypothetical protein DRG20_00075 [Deltaproteobacteria bacterium]
MKDPEQKAKIINTEIANRIRELRNKKGLSLSKLAQKTGFAKSYLSQIENMKREPPISTLTKIAYAFGVDIMYLITGQKSEEEEEKFVIIKAHERKTVNKSEGSKEYQYQSITYKKKNRLMDGYILTAGFEFPSEPLNHEGEELVFMLEGKQEVIYDGKRYIAEEGDCFYFDSNRPHYARSIGNKKAKFLVVFCTKAKE